MSDAIGPKRVKTDNTEVESHSLPDQIAWEKHQAAKTAQASGSLGIKFLKTVPPRAP